MLRQVLFAGILLALAPASFAADRPQTNRTKLVQLGLDFAERLEARRGQAYYDLLASSSIAQRRLVQNPDIQLMFVDERGRPRFYAVQNINAARTISTDAVWGGGSAGLSLSGWGTALGKLGIWDGGGVRTTHQEFGGRVTQIDDPGSTHYHATHVAGTMVAVGVQAQARGMSFQANLAAYDWSSDEIEMAAAAAAGMNVSNHSYGFVTGWRNDDDWYWYGDIDISATEDYGFGFYGNAARDWDEIGYNAPYYLIVNSAGNNRNDTGPGPGGGHYVWDGDWVWSNDVRDVDCGPDGYDCVSWKATAKNILTVGSINDIPTGYVSPGEVVMTSYSAWGPTDDGRIKPDLVANGTALYSAWNTGDADYGSIGGTSMASPNASGSINLLVGHYETTHGGQTPLASTMKAAVIHTADESGLNDGPDYQFGWGLMNTARAAQLISDDVTDPVRIFEGPLADGETHEYPLETDGSEPLRMTIVWTDLPGTPSAPALDPPTLMLVHDLDIRLEHLASASVYRPYVLDPADPSAGATTGDNFRDNVEMIHISAPTAGSYRLTVNHKGTLSATQYYTLITSVPMAICYDTDADGVCVLEDNCRNEANPLQEDADGDGVGDACDNCPADDNPDQTDSDLDQAGDACDTCPYDPDKLEPGYCGCYQPETDSDGDTVPDCVDICPGQDDAADADGDAVPDGCDNCPDDYNPGQEDLNGDQIGDICQTCCRDRVGDANGLGGDEPTIGDISTMIDALFIGGDPEVIVCMAEADVNQSGGFDPQPSDITIGDISSLIDYLFIAGPILGLPNCL